ncbi:MAG: hypothetical protein LBI13_00455 [Streptococcaceae bacterium]|jgi:hypothetical protein|nr:hypothetical protein [Streptococcaceae bacterium]
MIEKLNKVVKKTITSSLSGGAAGSILKVEFEDDNYFFIYCDWRIENGGKFLVTSWDSTTPDGLISVETAKLDGKVVEKFEITTSTDWVLSMTDGTILRVFCSIGPSEQEYPENWAYHDRSIQKIIWANNKGQLEERDRT